MFLFPRVLEGVLCRVEVRQRRDLGNLGNNGADVWIPYKTHSKQRALIPRDARIGARRVRAAKTGVAQIRAARIDGRTVARRATSR